MESVIASLERRLHDAERKVNEYRGAANELRASINELCEQAGLPPRYPDGGGGGPALEGRTGANAGVTAAASLSATGALSARASLLAIASDKFHGKRQATAIKEFLEMRRAAGVGPAKPREIYDALKQGGYQFTAKEDGTALVGLRTTLRKNSAAFYKLPDGAYGLRSWYPHAKTPKAQTAGADAADGNAEPIEKSDAAAEEATPEQPSTASAA